MSQAEKNLAEKISKKYPAHIKSRAKMEKKKLPKENVVSVMQNFARLFMGEILSDSSTSLLQ